MKEILEASVDTDRFKINSVYASIVGRTEYAPYVVYLTQNFTTSEVKKILKALIRFSFYVEPVKQPTIDSTKFTIRWSDDLTHDTRFASFQACVVIFEELLAQLQSELEESVEKQNLLRMIVNNTAIAYELNVDYENRTLQGDIHTPDNVAFFWGELPTKVFALRKYLLNPNNHGYVNFFSATYDKISTKAFLTDRVLTGTHKTNREKRWECHPHSVHFALRKECLSIEAKLIEQICHFDGFPAELREILYNHNVVQFSGEVSKCPITLDPISFANFQNEVLNPIHGKAAFQVGHMHPLKSVIDNEFSGHTADNISWVSSIGNRIQGELSVDETREVILRIFENYQNAGLIP